LDELSTEGVNSRSEVNTSERAASARYLLNALSLRKFLESAFAGYHQSYFCGAIQVVAIVPKMT